MLKVIAFVVSVAVLVGCGGASGPCSQRTGTYRIKYVEESGTCGALPDQTVTSTTQPTAPPAGCTGQISTSADNCEVTLVDVACPGATGYTVHQNGKAEWSQDGKSATASITFNIITDATGASYCTSTYDVTYTKL
jgi:hypothetical protein